MVRKHIRRSDGDTFDELERPQFRVFSDRCGCKSALRAYVVRRDRILANTRNTVTLFLGKLLPRHASEGIADAGRA
jgi:hypothetical protein